MFSTIIIVLLFSLILFIIYRLTIKYTPKIIFNQDGSMTQILNKMPSLKKPYKPLPWFFNCHIMTLYGLRLRGRSSYKPIREDVIFKDGAK